MNRKGVTLIEMLVVITIIGILSGIGIGRYYDMRIKTSVENDAKRVYSISAKAREMSFTWKEELKLVYSSDVFKVVKNSDNSDVDGMSTTLDNPFTFGGSTIIFKNGFSSITVSGTAAASGFLRYNSNKADAQYDCVLYQWNRVRLGKYEGTNCTPK